jgi:hypothetical protein
MACSAPIFNGTRYNSACFCTTLRRKFYGNQTEIQEAGQYYIYALKESMTFITPIFNELRLLNSITRYSIRNLAQNGLETSKA